ncbi:MAG: gephyrin-like molybdotransferase Glp [Thermodesulfobacteriota bacterium]
MKEFFKVTDLDDALGLRFSFNRLGKEEIPVQAATGRVLAEDIVADVNLPDFPRAIMDGFAVRAASTFGASDGSPAYINVPRTVAMGEIPAFSLGPGEAAKISTGGMLPKGTDSVVMVEHTDAIDETTIEVFKSVAPGQNMVAIGEDIKKDRTILSCGQRLRPQETGLLAAFGRQSVLVFKQPVIGILSTGDEIVPIDTVPSIGKIRDINSYTLAGQVLEAGGIPLQLGIVEDDYDELLKICKQGLAQSDMLLVSGGSSVGMRDFTVDVLAAIPDTKLLLHGISISPGKPTILARSGDKAFWGLPGHVVSAMVVFHAVVQPFIDHVSGLDPALHRRFACPATLSRSVASSLGRVDYVRVKLVEQDGAFVAEPILGKSGLINTMLRADGLVKIDKNTEGLDAGAQVNVLLFAS